MDKRGTVEQTYFWIFYLVLVMIVSSSLFYYISNSAEGVNFEQNYLAMDLGLLLNAVVISPGNIRVVYEVDKEYIFDFDEDKLSVDVEEGNFVIYNYNKIGGLSVSKTHLVKPKRIIFEKKGDSLLIEGEYE